ncbi:MAG: hypothetical protein Q7R85_03675 [bacterium]|nr:hypothetical protein [bacterium]
MRAIEQFRSLAAEDRFKGWPLVGEPEPGPKIPFFGGTLNYKLRTGNGVEDFTSIIRHFGWAVCFGIVNPRETWPDNTYPEIDHGPHVVTLCQWKPGVNQASWELPPGGIGKIDPNATLEEITEKTKQAYLKETGLGGGNFKHIGHVMIETGKYRGAGPNDHGLRAHLFLATGLGRVQDARKPNPNEIMETLMVPLDEFPEVLASGLFVEESAVVCAYKALVEVGLLRWSK